MVVKPNTAGARCCHRKVAQNPHSVQADTHDYFLPRPGRLSSKSGPDMIISCGDEKCSTLTVLALRLGGVMSQRLHQNPHHIWWCAWSGWWPWCSKKLHQIPTLAGWCSHCCTDRLVFQKMGWCSKKLFQNPQFGGDPKVGVVFQNVVPESQLCILLSVCPLKQE